MAEYSGSIDLISGIRPKNNGKFPLVNAKDVQVDNDGTRLDAKINEILLRIPSSAVIMTEAEYSAAVKAGKVDPNTIYLVTKEGS